MTCIPSPDACLIGRHGHYCDEPIGHTTPLHMIRRLRGEQ